MALLTAANPIDAARGLRGGASLAVFGALATVNGVRDGVRSAAMVWAIPTCVVLLIVAGLLSVRGRGDVIAPASMASVWVSQSQSRNVAGCAARHRHP
jgi:hypothetical protein